MSPSDREGQGLAGMFAKMADLDDEDDLDVAFARSIVRDAGEREPRLPSLLRACAIPRQFDRETVEVLLGVLPADTADAASTDATALFNQIARYRFVLPLDDGVLTYHDNFRDAVLRDWRSQETGLAQLRGLNESLADMYKRRYDNALDADRQLASLGPTMRRANAQRFRRLRGRIRRDMARSLLEALYHKLEADVDEGIRFFTVTCDELSGMDTGDVVRSLVAAARDALLRRTDDERTPERLAAIDLYETRVLRQSPPYDFEQAEEEGEPGPELIHLHARGNGRLDVGDAVGQGKGDFLHRGGAGFPDVVAADADGVPLGHFLGAVGEDVGDEAHGGPGRKM